METVIFILLPPTVASSGNTGPQGKPFLGFPQLCPIRQEDGEGERGREGAFLKVVGSSQPCLLPDIWRKAPWQVWTANCLFMNNCCCFLNSFNSSLRVSEIQQRRTNFRFGLGKKKKKLSLCVWASL